MRVSVVSNAPAECPAARSGWLSHATFWYTRKIFAIGLKRDFTEEDLTKPLDAHRSGMLGDKLSRKWVSEVEKSEIENRKPCLLFPIMKCFGWEIFAYGIALTFMELAIRIFQPIFIGLILRYFSVANESNKRPWGGYTYLSRAVHYWDRNDQCAIILSEVILFAFLTIFCSFIAVLIIHPVFTMLNFCGMKIRIAICSLIYRKVLRLDSTLLNGKMIGNVINILSNDVNKFEQLHFIHYLWLGPLTVAASLVFLYQEIQMASILGMCPVMFCIPLQIFLGFLTKVVRIETAGRTDNRVQVMNEIIQGIRVIKMYAWEYPFSNSLDKTRRYEMRALIKASIIKGVIMSLILFITRSGHFFSTWLFLRSEGNITIETIFFVVSYYQILRMTMTVYYPQGVGHVSEMYVSLIRIKEFLSMPESDIANPEPMDVLWKSKLGSNRNYQKYYNKIYEPPKTRNITIQNASLRYSGNDVLSNITLKVVPGELTAVVGPVGSGKSCLLHLILGELHAYKGTCKVDGVVSYATQDPFLFAGSIRQNILFGSSYDRRRYNFCVKICALSRDFTLLPYGDRTLVGEKGISLSGGQRARINLARAVYREADIYLLDDPLSAVDTNVGKHLYEDCITGFLGDKTVILTTHQWQYLKNAPQIMFLEDGKIKSLGDYQDVFASSELISKLIPDEQDQSSLMLRQGEDDEVIKRLSMFVMKSVKSMSVGIKKPSGQKEFSEMRSTGVVGCRVLKNYYRSGGNWFFIILMFLLFILAQVAASTFDYFMAIWAKVEDKKTYGKANSAIPYDAEKLSRNTCVLIAATAVGATMFIALFRSFYFYGFCMRASVKLHNKMFRSVTRANLRFFTLNASGRILNRFSKDMGAVDEMLPYAMVDTYQILLNFVGVIWLLFFVNYWLILVTAFVIFLFYIIRRYYLKASCSLKRLEGIARSPVFTHVNASMQGLAVIRSHGNEMILVEEFDNFQDIHTSASFMFMAASRAFGYLLDLITVIYTTGIIYFFLYVSAGGGANVALIVTQCIGLTGIFQWGMRQSAEFETQLTAVERILEFTTIEPEPPLESKPGRQPPKSWPKEGRVELINLSLRYSLSEPAVLKNVNIIIRPQEKIGIVGRTGAGKSSIIQCLFRLAYIEGKIIIDGIETGSIGLHDLRKKISIIPQEPVIFSGTLRYNLDPFKEYSDVMMYSALVDVDLKLAVSPQCLDEYMSDGGVNLSVGSRQLVCLARAIVRNNKILILDEATANVDLQTDNFIQKTIREKFAHCTVITIAHRLNTIMDSDKVLVMEAGKVVEYDHPYTLMNTPKSMFSDLISKTGPQNVVKFREIAKETYEAKFGR